MSGPLTSSMWEGVPRVLFPFPRYSIQKLTNYLYPGNSSLERSSARQQLFHFLQIASYQRGNGLKKKDPTCMNFGLGDGWVEKHSKGIYDASPLILKDFKTTCNRSPWFQIPRWMSTIRYSFTDEFLFFSYSSPPLFKEDKTGRRVWVEDEEEAVRWVH